VDQILAAIRARPSAEQIPTAEERLALGRLAQDTANVPEGTDPAGVIYCRFTSARAANMAVRRAETGDAGLIDLVAGGGEGLGPLCAASTEERTVMPCRQLRYLGVLGRSRAAGHPAVLASLGPMSDIDPAALGSRFVDFGASAGAWPEALTDLSGAGAPAEEVAGARAELRDLSCQVQEAGARLVGEAFGLPRETRRAMRAASLGANAAAAQGLGLALSAEAQAVCQAEPGGELCLRERENSLISLCRQGGGNG
jgi:hypothetical protein